MIRSDTDPAALRQLADTGAPLTPVARAALLGANSLALAELRPELTRRYPTPEPRVEQGPPEIIRRSR